MPRQNQSERNRLRREGKLKGRHAVQPEQLRLTCIEGLRLMLPVSQGGLKGSVTPYHSMAIVETHVRMELERLEPSTYMKDDWSFSIEDYRDECLECDIYKFNTHGLLFSAGPLARQRVKNFVVQIQKDAKKNLFSLLTCDCSQKECGKLEQEHLQQCECLCHLVDRDSYDFWAMLGYFEDICRRIMLYCQEC